MAFVIFFGAKAIKNTTEISKTVDYETFIDDVQERFDSVSILDYGSTVSLREVYVPTDVKEVCFVDSEERINIGNVKDEKLKKIIDSGVDADLFFVNGRVTYNNVGRVFELEENPLCDSTFDDRLDVKLINQGNVIRVEKA